MVIKGWKLVNPEERSEEDDEDFEDYKIDTRY